MLYDYNFKKSKLTQSNNILPIVILLIVTIGAIIYYVKTRPIKCEETEWSRWSKCSKECGGGTKSRSRLGKVGEKCEEIIQTTECNNQECPIDCQWGEWEDIGLCDPSTGTQTQHREKIVKEEHDGNCDGSDTQEIDCPVDCVWDTTWHNANQCDISTGTQTQYRTKVIEEKNGGICEEEDLRTVSCSVDCQWGEWENDGECDKETGIQKQKRTKIVDEINGGECQGESSREINCDVDCEWGEWENEGECNLQNGKQRQHRERLVRRRNNGSQCEGPATQDIDCNVDCTWSEWKNQGSCDKNTGLQKQRKIKEIEERNGGTCSEQPTRNVNCDVDCEVSILQPEWSECSKSCGGGTQNRSRTITTQPKNNGEQCPTDLTETRECNTHGCRIDCVWSDEWINDPAGCDEETGRLRQVREKLVVENESGSCSGSNERFVECDVDCTWSEWENQGSCDENTGLQKQRRIKEIEERNGGTCSEQTTRNVNCDVDCVQTDYSNWSECSQKCGGGTRTKTSTITTMPRNNGKECEPAQINEPCNQEMCSPTSELLYSIYFDSGLDSYDLVNNAGLTLHGNPTIDENGLVMTGESGNKGYMTMNVNYSGNHTIAYWMKLSDNNPGYGGILDSAHNGTRILLTSDATQIYVQTYNGGNKTMYYSNYPKNTWFHLVLVIESNSSAKLYANGAVVDQDTGNGWNIAFNGSHEIGRWDYNSRLLKGNIKSLNIWERALTAEDIKNLYDQGRNYSILPIECGVSEWSVWSECSSVCGNSTKTRSRRVIISPHHRECPTLIESDVCDKPDCIPTTSLKHSLYFTNSTYFTVATDMSATGSYASNGWGGVYTANGDTNHGRPVYENTNCKIKYEQGGDWAVQNIMSGQAGWAMSAKIGHHRMAIPDSRADSIIPPTNQEWIRRSGATVTEGSTFKITKSHINEFDDFDLTGNSSVTLHGNPTVDNDGIHLLKDTSSYFSFPSNHGGPMTLAMWIKIDEDSHHGDVWRQLYGGGANFNITLTSYLALKGQPQNGPKGQFGWVYYDENVWYHMVVVIEGADIHPKWYMNGVKTGSDNSFSGALSSKTNRTLIFGKQLQCVIKSVNIWERALPAEEIKNLYDQGRNHSILPLNGLLSDWVSDGERSNRTVIIESQNKYLATLSGAAMGTDVYENISSHRYLDEDDTYIFAVNDGSWFKMVSTVIRNNKEVAVGNRKARYIQTSTQTNDLSALTDSLVTQKWNSATVGTAGSNGYLLSNIRRETAAAQLESGACFWGDSEVSNIRDLTEDECLDLCEIDLECDGLTYNPRKEDGRSNCWLRKGVGDVNYNCGSTDKAYIKSQNVTKLIHTCNSYDCLQTDINYALYFDPNVSNYDLTGKSNVIIHNAREYLKGAAGDGIRFPTGSIPSNFTIITVSRYAGSNKRRIFDATSGNWLHAHHSGDNGVTHYSSWKTEPHRKPPGYNEGDWLIFGGQNKSSGNFITTDGVNNIATAQGGLGNLQLTISHGQAVSSWGQETDWEVSEVLIWNKHLTPAEFKDAYDIINMNKKPLDTFSWPQANNLVGWYHPSTFASGGVGTKWPNSFGSLGDASVSRGSVTKISPIDQNGLKLDRSLSQYADMGKTTVGDTVTFAIWCNVHSVGNWHRLFDFGNGQSNENIFLAASEGTNNKIIAAGYVGTSEVFRVISTSNVTYKSWMHVVLVIDKNSNVITLYVNGTSNSTTIPSNFPARITRSKSYIGRSNWTHGNDAYFDGQIKSINIWDRAFSATEVEYLYSNGKDFAVINPVEYYRAKSIVLSKDSTKQEENQHFNVSELQVFDENGVNVALSSYGSVVTASSQNSTYKSPQLIDGNTNSGSNFANTGGSENPKWFKVVFPHPVNVSRIRIQMRSGYLSNSGTSNTRSRYPSDVKLYDESNRLIYIHSPTEWPELWKEIPLYSDNNKIDDTVELINYPTEISSLCGKSATGDDRTKMNWYGKICEGDKIQWNRMESTKNLKSGATATGCRWVRTQGSSSWQQDWVGGCGVTPKNVPGLPMTVSAVKQHNDANPICWRRMPTGCAKNLSETTENETIAPNANHDTGWFIDHASPTTAKCTERITSFNNYCVKDDAQTRWTGSKPTTISHGWELPSPPTPKMVSIKGNP